MKSNHVMTAFAATMLAYQAWRVFDYMKGSLQGVSDLTKILVAIAFLSFSEIGLLIWLHHASKNSTSDAQETICTVMIGADFIGSMVIGLADILKHNTIYDVDLSIIDPILLVMPWLMVVLNVGGYVIYTLTDSKRQLDQAERELEHEENMLEVESRRAAVQLLRKEKKLMVDDLAPHYYRSIRDSVTGRTRRRFAKEARQQEQDEQAKETAPTEVLATTSSNGNKPDGGFLNFTRQRKG